MKTGWLRLVGAVAPALALVGCATTTPVSGDFPPVTPRQAQASQYTGTTVRWGGILIKTTPQAHETCFRVMGLPLDRRGRPEAEPRETETGRFVACAPGFYDPVLYATGREITFVGTVGPVKTETVGSYQYPYPQLAARVVYLWPKRTGGGENERWYYNGYYRWQPGWWWWDQWGPEPPPPYDRPLSHHRPPAHPPAPSTAPQREPSGVHRRPPPSHIPPAHPARPPRHQPPPRRPASPQRPAPSPPATAPSHRPRPSHPPVRPHPPVRQPPQHEPRPHPHPQRPPPPGSRGRGLAAGHVPA